MKRLKEILAALRMSISASHLKSLPLLALCIALAASLTLWRMIDLNFRAEAESYFKDISSDITRLIINRLNDHEQVLLGGAGLFNAKRDVSRDEWRRYISTLQLDQNLPGILGIGYCAMLTPEEKTANIQAVRAEGFPEYTIRPDGERQTYSSVLYIEPFNWRNQRAFGYDMYSEPVRRIAMDKAIDEGATSIATNVTLTQETDKDRQTGMLMYVPIYRQGAALDSPEKRRAAIRGCVYSPIRMNDFIYGTLQKLPQDMAFDIYASAKHAAEDMIFSSVQAERIAPQKGFKPEFNREITVSAYGRHWHFHYSTLPKFTERLEKGKSYAALGLSIFASLLLAALTAILQNTRNKALSLAERMTHEMRKGEQELRRQSTRLAEVIWGTNVGTWEWNLATGETVLNERWVQIIGYSLAEISPAGADVWRRFAHPEDIKASDERIKRHFGGIDDLYECEMRMRHKSGEWIWTLSRGRVVEWSQAGNPLRMSGTLQDITKRKHAEEELQYHNKLSRLLVSISDEFISMPVEEIDLRIRKALAQVGDSVTADSSYVFLLDPSGETMRYAYEWCAAGVKPQKEELRSVAVKDTRWWMGKLNANEAIKVDNLQELPPEAEAEREILAALSVQSVVALPINEKGSPLGFLGFDSVTKPHPWPEETVILLRMVADIIANALSRKRQMEALALAGRNFDIFFNTVEDLLFVLSLDGKIIHLNDTATKRLGYAIEELLGQPATVLHPPGRSEEAKSIIAAMADGRTGVCPIPLMSKGKELIPAETRIVKGEWNGEPALFGVTKDISSRVMSEQKFTSAFQMASVLMTISRLDNGQFINANEAFLKAMGFSHDEVTGRTAIELNLYANPADRRNIYDTFNSAGRVDNVEVTMRRRDGTPLPVLFSSVPINIDSLPCWLVSMVDIAALKQTERKLRDSEEQIRLLLDSSGEGIYGLDLDGNCTLCNKACLRLLGYSSPDELLGRNMHNMIHHKRADGTPFPVEDCRIFQAFKKEVGTHVDDEVLWRSDGSPFPAEYWSYPQRRNGVLVGAVVTFYDITERKQAERQIEQDLKEKEMLLREIHHRVKNNMAVVSSLLALQAEATRDENAKRMLEESQQRIKSMSLVHEKLYRSKNMANIDFGDYITTIVMELRSAYAKEGKTIKSTIDVGSVVLDIDSAIPCGLILNELVTNAFKYAFKGRQEGEVRIRFAKENGKCVLTVADNGVGLPPYFDCAKTNTLGLQIVDALSRQLRGSLQFKSGPDGGTEATVTFMDRGGHAWRKEG